MTTLGFVLLIITWIIVGLATKGRKHTSQNQWQREDKRKRLEEEYAQNLKVWRECKEDMKRRLKDFLGR
ncbi:MAG: hypothetical protein PUK14_06160 [Clostridiales bacterium]|nr:hypothetical protein [Clostridiales bacterium]